MSTQRATDRAREALRHLSGQGLAAGIGSDHAKAGMREIERISIKTLPAALDFADAVEAAQSGLFPKLDTRKALDEFYAALDRAAGGAS